MRNHHIRDLCCRGYALLGAAALTWATGLTSPPWQADAAAQSGAGAPSTWISFRGGRLVYGADAYGNHIPDFSSVGYHAGDRAIPGGFPVRVTLGPGGSGDDTARVQAAVERTARDGGGAVVLRPGTYRLAGTVHLNRSGVVLHGSGSRTVLTGTGKPHTLVAIGGVGKISRSGQAHHITDRYVPVGSHFVHVNGAQKYFKRGDSVIVHRPMGHKWIHAIGMDRIPPRPDGKPVVQWKAGVAHDFERTVLRVSGNAISLDVPLPQALESEYTNASVWTYRFPGRIGESGLEDLAATGSAIVHGSDYINQPLVTVNNAENSWVRSVTVHRSGHAFYVGSGALHTSIVNTQALDISVPQSIHARPAAYTIVGQQTLIRGCRVKGTNLHAWTTLNYVPGPNVITDCTAINTGPGLLFAGPHERWATGTLYDRVRMNATGTLVVTDAGNSGSGHGWTGANTVLWNCSVGTYQVEKPPTAYNWAIGCTGRQASADPGHQPGEFQSSGRHVSPSSLYLEQLKERHATGHSA